MINNMGELRESATRHAHTVHIGGLYLTTLSPKLWAATPGDINTRWCKEWLSAIHPKKGEGGFEVIFDSFDSTGENVDRSYSQKKNAHENLSALCEFWPLSGTAVRVLLSRHGV